MSMTSPSSVAVKSAGINTGTSKSPLSNLCPIANFGGYDSNFTYSTV